MVRDKTGEDRSARVGVGGQPGECEDGGDGVAGGVVSGEGVVFANR